MLLLLGTLLRLLTPKNFSAYKDILQSLQQSIFQDIQYNYDNLPEKLNFQTLHIRRRHSDALFLINLFSGAKYCSSVLSTVGIRVPARNIRNFTMFNCPSSHRPLAICVSAAKVVCKYTDIFRNSGLYINNFN
jgi:hypothetical protein